MVERLFQKPERKLFTVLTILLAGYVFPLILADRFYRDDASRALLGVGGWNGDGRPLTELLLRLFSFGRPLADLFPLPLLLSVILLSGTFTIYLSRKTGISGLSFLLVFAAFIPAANPFFLPNLSYRFDSVTMTLSLCLPFLMFSFPLKKRWGKLLMDTLLLLAVWCLFQPSVGVYFALLFLEPYFDLQEGQGKGRPEAGKLLTAAGALALSSLIYLLLIAPRFVDRAGWRAQASEIGLSPALLVRNIGKLCSVAAPFFAGLTKPALLSAGLFFVLSWALLVLRLPDRRLPARLYTLFLPVLLTAAGIAPLLALSHMKTSEHMLVSLAVPLLLTGLGALCGQEDRRVRTVFCVLGAILMFWSFQYSYAYGNAMKSQKEYERYIAESIARDLDEADPDGMVKEITFEGTPPRSPECAMLIRKYPAFEETVPVSFENDNWLGAAFLYHFLQRDLSCTEPEGTDWKALSPVKRNALYSMIIEEDRVFIVFLQKSR